MAGTAEHPRTRGQRPRASIIIVTYGQRAVTERCLASLDVALGPELGDTFELVLVDNASPDDTLELLSAWQDRATVLALFENRDFAGGCNAGAAVARGDVLIFLNNDTVVGPGTLASLAATAAEPGVGAAGLRLLFPDGTLQHGGVIMVRNPAPGGAVLPFHLLYRHDGELPAARGGYELDCVTGACLAVPRAVFEELGGFDEGYHNGYEDVDLCLRVRTSGRSVVYRGDLVIEHHEGSTRAGTDDVPNILRLQSAWGAVLDQDDALAAASWDADVVWDTGSRTLAPSDLVVVGNVSGFGPDADEARALLLALERAGTPAVAVDLPPAYLRPRVDGATAAALDAARSRLLPSAGGVRIHVAAGAATARRVPPGAILRAGRSAHDGRTAGVLCAVETPGAAWAAPPVDAPPSPGPGGGGVLVDLPAHDVPGCRAMLSALAELQTVPVRLVPTVGVRGLATLVAELLPDAELLAPCGSESAWARLAATADVALCCGSDDPFERRPLVAAAWGATPILRAGNGPAAGVLGSAAPVADAGDLAQLTRAAVAAAPGQRAAVARLVRDACDPARVGRQVLALLGRDTTVPVAA
jgi:GT2 family glycosyltransferase